MTSRRIDSYVGLWARPDRALYVSDRRGSPQDRLVIVSDEFGRLVKFVSLLQPCREFSGSTLLFRLPSLGHLSDEDHVAFLRKAYFYSKTEPGETLRLFSEEQMNNNQHTTGNDRS